MSDIKNQIQVGINESKVLISELTYKLLSLQERTYYLNITIVHITNALSKLSTHITTVIRNNLFALSNYQTAVSDWVHGAMLLTKGELSEAMISPVNLENMIKNVSANIDILGGDLKLLTTHAMDYFHTADIIYAISGDTIVIQVPMPLTPRKGSLYTLNKLYTPPWHSLIPLR